MKKTILLLILLVSLSSCAGMGYNASSSGDDSSYEAHIDVSVFKF